MPACTMYKCESCKGIEVERYAVNRDLNYWICRTCGHCLKAHADDLNEDFKNAQETYFGDNSILLETKPSVMDHEVLSERRRLVDLFIPSPVMVIEVGPGSGLFAEMMIKRGHQLVLVEQSPVLSKSLSKKLGVDVVVGAFEACNLPLDTATAFCSFHVIEHVADPLVHLQTALRAVKTGGFGIVATPNARSWQQRAFRWLSPNFDAAHLRVFSVESLCRLCVNAGWEIVAIETPEYTIGWMRVLSKALRKLRGEDDVQTGGKYAAAVSSGMEGVFRGLSMISKPVRSVQRLWRGGNEICLVLRKSAE